MKRFFSVIGIIFLVIVVLLNIFLTANLDASEHITISFNNIFYIIGLIITGLIIYFASSAGMLYQENPLNFLDYLFHSHHL